MTDTTEEVAAGAEAEAAKAAAAEKGNTPTPPESDAARKNGKSVQERIDELTRKQRDAERRAERLEHRNEELAEMLLKQPKAEPTADKSREPGKPTPQQFTTYEEYVEAVADWKAEQKAEQHTEKVRKDAETERQSKSLKELHDTFGTAEDEARGRIEDYDDVVHDKSLPIPPEMARIIMQADKPADLAYAVCKDRNECLRIAKLPPLEAARAIGRIEAKLETGQVKDGTKAPGPPATLKGGSSEVEKDPDKMTTDEWLKHRRAQLAKQTRRRA